MKWLLILLLPFSILAQTNDTASQMIYYQKSLIKKGKVELYVYSSYDIGWADESGMGINITLSKKKKKKKKKHKH